MFKKAQAAVFISIAAIILIAAGFAVYLSASDSGVAEINLAKTSSIEDVSLEIKNYIESCISLVAEPIVASMSIQGGKLIPGSGIFHKETELTVFCTDEADLGCINNLILRENMELELSDRVASGLSSCIDFGTFRRQGVDIEEGSMAVTTQIERETVSFKLEYPLTVSLRDVENNMKDFISQVNHPLGRLHGVAVDITNSEISKGYFDKDSWMIEHGFEIAVEKKRPYPHIIYILRKEDPRTDANFTFQFAIKGFDSVGTNQKRIPQKSNGCCTSNHGVCFENVVAAACPGEYAASNSCVCEPETESLFSGCCVAESGCFASNEQECVNQRGAFKVGDTGCSSCTGNDCKSTYIPGDGAYTGPPKKQGDSWCMYDGSTGFGFDFVGSRHYVHSCINGQEVLEECRDFREEICVEDDYQNTKNARCRINRWHDCALQPDEASCEDVSVRDCFWIRGVSNRGSKCTPHVPPGLRFWDGKGEEICQYGSEHIGSYQRMIEWWGHTTYDFCFRLGDCGNHRNIVDDLTKRGYFNRYGEEKDSWYIVPGRHMEGHLYSLYLPLDAETVPLTPNLPTLGIGTDATCGLWQPPNSNTKCSECSAPFKICTEYRCKSLGSSCQFSVIDDVPTCSSGGAVDEEKPDILFDESILTFGYSAEISNNAYYSSKEVKIVPDVNPYQEFTFGLTTSKPSRCKVSLRPPNIPRQLWDSNPLFRTLPQGWISNTYQDNHNVTLRFPDKSLHNLTEFLLFLRCDDRLGNTNEDELFINVNTRNPAVLIEPKILASKPKGSELQVTNQVTPVSFYVNKPFRECRYSSLNVAYDSMKDSFKCNTTVYQMSFFNDAPLGSYRCDGQIKLDKHRYYMNCQDWFGNVGSENFRLEVP